jgi:hypothetical protein
MCALALPLLVAGCGDDDDDTTAATTAAPTAAARTYDVTLADYKFEGVPDTMAANSKLAVKNSSAKEVHELVAIQLKPGENRPMSELVKLPEAEFQALAATPGPPAAVLVAPPNAAGFGAVGDGTLSRPGRYALVCFIPKGANPQEYLAAAQASQGGPPQVAGGPPHVADGMYEDVTVS